MMSPQTLKNLALYEAARKNDLDGIILAIESGDLVVDAVVHDFPRGAFAALKLNVYGGGRRWRDFEGHLTVDYSDTHEYRKDIDDRDALIIAINHGNEVAVAWCAT